MRLDDRKKVRGLFEFPRVVIAGDDDVPLVHIWGISVSRACGLARSSTQDGLR